MKPPRRIWVLSELYYPEEVSTGYLLTKIAEGLATDFSVGVVTGPATQFFRRSNALAHEVRHGVEIHRCAGTNFSKDSLFGRFANMLTRSGTMLLKSLRLCRKQDIVLVVTNPPVLPFVALCIRWIKRCPYVLLVHDVYPEALVAAGLMKPGSFIFRAVDWANRVLYRNAICIVTLGRAMSRIARAKLTRNRDSVFCIPNWAELETIQPAERSDNALLRRLGIQDRFVVLYAGNMGRTHGIEQIAHAALALREHSLIHFIFLGFGAKKQWLESFVAEHQLQNVSILPSQPRSEQNVFLNACDLAVIAFVEDMAGVSVPSRVYNHMAAGKPIIAVADTDSDLSLLVKEEQIGWTISPSDIDGLVQTILEASASPERSVEMGKRARSAALRSYSFDAAITAYKTLFERLFTK